MAVTKATQLRLERALDAVKDDRTRKAEGSLLRAQQTWMRETYGDDGGGS